MGLPAGLRELPPRRAQLEAVAQRLDLLGDQRVPGAAGLGGRQPASRGPDPPEGARHLRRLAQAGMVRRPADLQGDAAVRRAGAQEALDALGRALWLVLAAAY